MKNMFKKKVQIFTAVFQTKSGFKYVDQAVFYTVSEAQEFAERNNITYISIFDIKHIKKG